jgi:ribonuclease P protein component
MNKDYRVKKSNEIEAILKNKQFYSNRYFSVYVKTNPETIHFRYVISVGKKIGNAVNRNLLKRKIRAALTEMKLNLNNNVDVFIIAKEQSKSIDYKEIYKQLEYLFKKQKLLQGEKNE